MNNDVRQLFGDQVKKYRKEFSCSQQDLGELTGLGVTYINLLESYSVSAGLDSMARIADVFGVKFYAFVNPGLPLPAPAQLPTSTKRYLRQKTKDQEAKTAERDKLKQVGEKIYKTGVAKGLHGLIDSGFFRIPRTANEAYRQLNGISIRKKLTAAQQKEVGKYTVTLSQGRFPKLLDKLEPAPGSIAVRFVARTPGTIAYLDGPAGTKDMAADGG